MRSYRKRKEKWKGKFPLLVWIWKGSREGRAPLLHWPTFIILLKEEGIWSGK